MRKLVFVAIALAGLVSWGGGLAAVVWLDITGFGAVAAMFTGAALGMVCFHALLRMLAAWEQRSEAQDDARYSLHRRWE